MQAGSPDRVERRLAAILAADVAGYSRLMGQDEAGTLARVNTLRRELIAPKLAEHKGRIVKTTGDGLLVEFPSVVEAVACAVGVQREMVERNTSIPADQRIEFRVGIHQGDIIVEGDDIFGDGVNIAARLEGLAEPGGICVSARVQEDAAGKLDQAFADLGEQALKNIARPVRVYRIALDNSALPAPAALPLPDKPSLVVLPFQNMSGDPEQEYFADGMVEEITTAIARLPWLFVIARNSAFTYKGQAVDVKRVARDLGVRYVLEGSIRKAGNRVRITGQLIDTASGAHIWADRFDGTLDDIFELQDEIAANVAGAIEPRLRQSEIDRANRKPTESLDAYDLYLRALAQVYRYTIEGFESAGKLLRQVLTIDASYVPAAALLSWTVTQQRGLGQVLSDDDLADAVRLARQALREGRDDPDTLWQAAWTLFSFAREPAAAMASVDRAVVLFQNSGTAWACKGWIHALCNQPVLAIEALNRALRLSPFDPIRHLYDSGLAIAHLADRQFLLAIEWADRALNNLPIYSQSWRVKVVANAHLGRLEEAQIALNSLLAIHPGWTIAQWRAASPYMAPELLDLYTAGLRRAGMPEE